jgi:hypothetical protein
VVGGLEVGGVVVGGLGVVGFRHCNVDEAGQRGRGCLSVGRLTGDWYSICNRLDNATWHVCRCDRRTCLLIRGLAGSGQRVSVPSR